MAKEFTDSEMDNLLAQESLIVIDFWAEWCGPCKKLSPVIDELAEEYDGVVDIRKCDVEEMWKWQANSVSWPSLQLYWSRVVKR